MTEKGEYIGLESGKSSNRWFRNSNTGAGSDTHPKGNGASAGDGRTTDPKVAGKVEVTFREVEKKVPKTPKGRKKK